MKLETLNCNNCGAPLEVPETANFVTCNHCEARLAIRRTESTTSTEQLDQIEKKQDRLLEKVTSLERQNRVAQIDRQWDREKQRLLITDKHGNRHEPNETMAIAMGMFVVAVGVIWMVTAAQMASHVPFPIPFWMFGFVFIFVGVAMAVYQYDKAGEFRAAKRRYHRARRSATQSTSDTGRRSSDEFLSQLDHIPTPGEYLEQLGEQDSAGE